MDTLKRAYGLPMPETDDERIVRVRDARLYRLVRDRAERIDRMRHDRGWALAATVGIPRDACCLHNASIDEDLLGWCFRNPERLKVAKRAIRMVDDWSASRIADRIIARLRF